MKKKKHYDFYSTKGNKFHMLLVCVCVQRQVHFYSFDFFFILFLYNNKLRQINKRKSDNRDDLIVNSTKKKNQGYTNHNNIHSHKHYLIWHILQKNIIPYVYDMSPFRLKGKRKIYCKLDWTSISWKRRLVST